MKLTDIEKKIILDMGYREEDLGQIEAVQSLVKITDKNKKRINKQKAIAILGLEQYLSGLGRCAFHWTSERVSENGKQTVSFDAYSFFRN